MAVWPLLLIRLGTHSHLHAARGSVVTTRALILSKSCIFMTCNRLVPVLEGVVDDGPQQQPVSHLGGPSEGEHVNGPQRGVSLAQATEEGERETNVDVK